MDIKQLWDSFNWIHWKGWHNSFIAKYQHLHYSVIGTTLLFLSIAFDSNFLPEALTSCLLTENPTPVNHFCSFLLVFSLGLICHKESTFSPIHENDTKWVRVTPRLFWHPDPGLIEQLTGLGPPTSSAVRECDSHLTKLHTAACHGVWWWRVLFTKHFQSPSGLFLLKATWLTLLCGRKWSCLSQIF